MQKTIFVFLCALLLKVATAFGSEPVDLNKVFLIAENDADLFAANATVTDASSEPVVTTPATTTTESAPVSSTSSTPTINNNITVTPQSSGASEAAALLSAKAKEEETQTKTALIPVIGGTRFSGGWSDHIGNDYTFGLLIDFPLSKRLSLEAEGDYGKHRISYSYFSHNFSLYSFGGNAKLYLMDKSIRPYIGAGFLGNYFENMSHGPSYPDRYNHLLGSGQLLAGAEMNVAQDLDLGLRLAWVNPLLNRAATYHNGVYSYPYYEESAAIDSAFYRLLVTTKISF